MADVASSIYAWSSTESSNSPSGSTTIGTGMDDNLRQIQASVATYIGLVPHIENLTLAFSVAASALTIAVKTKAGTDPSTTDKAIVPFRNVTAATGDYTSVALTAATSLVISSGSTLGTTNDIAFRLWIVAFNDGGTLRLGVINCLSGTSIYPLSGWGIASATAEGGAGASDSAHVFYAGAAVSSKAYTVLGYVTWEAGLGAAGTWSAGPTRAQLFGPQVALPGHVVQVARNQDGAFATGTTILPLDDTIPENDEGDEYMTQAITPTSAANLLAIEHSGYFGGITGNAIGQIIAALFQDDTVNALAAAVGGKDTATETICAVHLEHCMLAGTTSASTLKIRAGGNAAGTLTFNGNSSARLFGGVYASRLDVREIMA